MRRLLRILFVVYLCANAGLPCSAGVTTPVRGAFTYMPLPRYPMEAWEWRSNGSRRIEGRTVCRLHLDAKGAVTGVQVVKSSGSKALDAASRETLQYWRAKPGRPGRFVDVPINFVADSARSLIFNGLGLQQSSDVGK
jgi:protein TonB